MVLRKILSPSLYIMVVMTEFDGDLEFCEVLIFLKGMARAYFREAVRQDFGGALKSRRVRCLLHDHGLEAAARQAQ